MENTHADHKLSPKFFFVSLGVLVSLIACVTSFLNLVFATLDKHFPDALNATYAYGYASYNYDSMRTALAMLIIMFPVFLGLSYAWTKMVRKGLGRVDAIIKKWMLYLVIFLASIVVVADLVTLVRYFVSGEITVRFIWKVIVTLAVANLAGLQYFKELDADKTPKVLRIVTAFVASALVLAAIIASFMVMGSPTQQRKLRFDDRRVQDLQSIQYQAINYWQQKEKLPATLADLSTPLTGTVVPTDPEFEKGIAYEYEKTGDLSFNLCATFALPMPKGWQEYSSGGIIAVRDSSETPVSAPGYPGGMNDSWDHQAGRTCFSRTIDKDIYPPYKKQPSE